MGILALTQFATFYTCREAAKHMRSQGGGGRIIIIGSVMSEFAAVGSTAYSGAKAAIKQMGKVMANELGEHGITVNTIQPGWMATLGEKRQTGHSDDYSVEEQSIPATRMGTPQDVGASVAFLCSDEAFCAYAWLIIAFLSYC
jgi:NAD(P)-dependent dehydrogenase (short-subunit alcohol dehydrogenase family)